MKKYLFFIAFLGLIIGGASCSSEYDANPNDNSNTRNPLLGDFQANINGNLFVAEQKGLYDTIINDAHTVIWTGVQYTAEKDPDHFTSMQLGIPMYKNPGIYLFDGGTATGTITMKDGGFLANYKVVANDSDAFINVIQSGSDWEADFHFKAARTTAPHDTLWISDGHLKIPR